eukprot:319349_1
MNGCKKNKKTISTDNHTTYISCIQILNIAKSHLIYFNYCAYFCVHSLANLSCAFLFVLYNFALSGTNGSSGFGSVNNEQIDNKTFETVNAGDQLSFKISKQIPPLSFTLQ